MSSRMLARLRMSYGFALVVVAFTMLLLTAAVYHALRMREETLTIHRELAQNLARIGEHELTVNLRMIDRLLETRAAQWQTARAQPLGPFEDQLRADLAGVPLLRSVSTIGADGRILASSIPGAAGQQLAASALAALRAPADASELRISKPWRGRDLTDGVAGTGPIDARQTPYFFALTRRAGAAANEAIIVAAVNASFIGDFYATLTQRPDFLVELFRYDGVLLVSSQPGQRQPGQDGSAHAVFSRFLPDKEIGLIENDIGPGGESDAGILAFRASRIYPVVIQVRMPQRAILAGWRNEMGHLAAAIAATVTFVMLMAVLLNRHQVRRRQVEDALTEVETRFGSLTALSADWYWEQDAEYRFVGFSGGEGSRRQPDDQQDVMGKTRWELSGVTPLTSTWEEHRAVLDARLPFRDFEYVRDLGDAGPRYLVVSGEPIFDRGGRFTGYRGTAREISERKRAQKLQVALYEISESAHAAADLPALFRRIHEIIGELLPARNFFVALYDEINEEVSFPYFIDEHDPVPPSRKLGAGGLTEVVLRTGEALLVTPDLMASMVRAGQHILGTDSLDWLGVPLRTDRRTIGVLTVQSYTGRIRYTERDKALLQFVSDQVAAAIERKQAEEALHAGEERYRSVIAAMAEGIVVCDQAGRIIDCNASAERMTGETLAHMRGRGTSPPDWELFAENGMPIGYDQSATMTVLRTKEPQSNVVTGFRKADGAMIWFSVNAQPLYGEMDSTLTGVVTTLTDITEKKESEALIWQHANFDALTQLPNRRMFRDRLEQAIKKCRREGLMLALLFIDLDRFKEVNDAFGHDKGDMLLIEAAGRIRDCVRESDTVARLGGDEFTVILSELESPAQVERIAQTIIDRLAAPFAFGEEQAIISASVGITLYPGDASEIEDLLKHADQALYVAKGAGRNRFGYFTPAMQAAAQARLRLTNDLRQALDNGQFRLFFQPMVHLATGEIQKAEALLRWDHPQRGVVSPAEFIPAAEAGGMIVDIGEWVLREAARWVKRWRQGPYGEFQVSVNQSPLEFQGERNSHGGWLALLEALELPGRSIVVEITEGLLLDASATVRDKLFRLRAAGVEVAIDDFGIGYSSLAYLKRFDIDYLKIDQSFIRNLAPGSSDMALSEAIIVMAHKLGLKVIAEGVETPDQRAILRAAGCDYGQGFLFAPPLPPEEFEAFLLAALPLL